MARASRERLNVSPSMPGCCSSVAIAAVAAVLLLTLATRNRALVPGRMQNIAEMLYEMIANMLRDNVGPEGRRYFPFIFTLFIFILFGNLLGMLPGSFTFTSHLVVTFSSPCR